MQATRLEIKQTHHQSTYPGVKKQKKCTACAVAKVVIQQPAIHLSALPLPAVVRTNIIAIAMAMAPPALGLPLTGLLWQ